MVRFFQDNISQDSNLYYILTMISLVGIVVCVSFVSSEKMDTDVEPFVITFSFGMGAIPWLMMSEGSYFFLYFFASSLFA
jgi:MFS transporter, SP family, ERD6-like sugar transporter